MNGGLDGEEIAQGEIERTKKGEESDVKERWKWGGKGYHKRINVDKQETTIIR